VFPELRDQALELAGKLAALEEVVEEARAAAERLVARKNTLAGEQQQLDALLLQKREQIAHNEEDLAEIQQLARLQAKSVADLGELIGKLDKAVAEAPKAKLGEYEQELERGTAPGQNEEPAETFRAQDGTVRLALGNPGRIKPALPFEKSKGLLPLPVQGRKILGFGDPTRYGSRSKGMAYATREGAQIRSPNDGWVVYAGEFRSYGQLLIINAGGGYHVLLAGLEQIYVTVGQFVLTGEPVGKMGIGRRSSDGTSGKDDPILYVEFRRKDRPIDPEPWWAKEPQKVAG
jgi:septal ring factor EnvC (AmiA/AmiB activator)